MCRFPRQPGALSRTAPLIHGPLVNLIREGSVHLGFNWEDQPAELQTHPPRNEELIPSKTLCWPEKERKFSILAASLWKAALLQARPTWGTENRGKKR